MANERLLKIMRGFNETAGQLIESSNINDQFLLNELEALIKNQEFFEQKIFSQNTTNNLNGNTLNFENFGSNP